MNLKDAQRILANCFAQRPDGALECRTSGDSPIDALAWAIDEIKLLYASADKLVKEARDEIDRRQATLQAATQEAFRHGFVVDCDPDDPDAVAQADDLPSLVSWIAQAEARARAERDEAYGRIKTLQAIVDRLPKDASGRHVIAHEDKLYHPSQRGVGFFNSVAAEFYLGAGTYKTYPVSECWPTEKAAEKAMST